MPSSPGRQRRERVLLVPWKPDVCEEFGCDERWPAFSRDGMGGPWRCREHDRTATRLAEPPAPSAREPAPNRLL